MLIDASHEEETRVVVVRGNRIEEFDFESQHKKQIRGNIYLAKVTRVEPSLQAAFVDYGGNRHGFLAFAEIHPDYYQIPLADRQALLKAEAEEHRRDEDVEHVETAPVDLSTQEQPDIGILPLDEQAAARDGAGPAEEAAAAAEAAEEAPVKKPKPRRSRKKAAAEPAAETTTSADADSATGEEPSAVADNEDEGTSGGQMAAMVETDSISEDVDVSKRRHDDDDDDDHDDHGDEEVIESVGA
jgi:ribonuclease E